MVSLVEDEIRDEKRTDHTLRLGRRSLSGFTDHFLHAHMTVDGRIGELKNHLIHFSYPDVHDVLEKLDRYSTGNARDMLASGKEGGVGKAVLHGLLQGCSSGFMVICQSGFRQVHLPIGD